MMLFGFLICSERYGSKLITKILDARPDICGPFVATGFYLSCY